MECHHITLITGRRIRQDIGRGNTKVHDRRPLIRAGGTGSVCERGYRVSGGQRAKRKESIGNARGWLGCILGAMRTMVIE